MYVLPYRNEMNMARGTHHHVRAPPPGFPLVRDVLKHPAFPTAMWNLLPDRAGLCPVAEGRGGPFNISWEIHGDGPVKLVFIMGLGGLKSAWQRQTLHFGHDRRDRYSVLVIDNRGIGASDKPLMRYSTSEMARDLLEVLRHVGWLPAAFALPSSYAFSASPPASPNLSPSSTASASSPSSSASAPPVTASSPSALSSAPQTSSTASSASTKPNGGDDGDAGGKDETGPLPLPFRRTLHLCGLSMGGMILQELACLVPSAVASMMLCCTAAAIENTTSFWENMASRASLLQPKSVQRAVEDSARSIFTPGWLAPDTPDSVALPDPDVTPMCAPPGPPIPAADARGSSRRRPVPSADPGLAARVGGSEAGEAVAAAGSAAESDSKGADTAAATTNSKDNNDNNDDNNNNNNNNNNNKYLLFETNAQRYVAQEMHKRLDPAAGFSFVGFLLQLVAAGWHHKTPAQLAAMADRVGRARILVMHGTADAMISTPHGRKLIDYVRPGVALVEDGLSHAPLIERYEWFNATVEDTIARAEALGREEK